MLYQREIETIGKFDVVIAGGGPGGLGAAFAAADLDMSVLIIERSGILGGCLTVGHVSPISGGFEKNTVADFLHSKLLDGKEFADIEGLKTKIMHLIDEKNICVFLNSSVCDVVQKSDSIEKIIISSQSGLKAVSGKIFIDATGDGVLSYLSGEKTEFGREDGLVQPMSVMFRISGVDENQHLMCFHEEHYTELKNGEYIQMCKDACKNGELPNTVNIVRLYPGSSKTERIVNATQVNHLNPLNFRDYLKAQIELRKQMDKITNFLKNNVEGFEHIKIIDSSDIVGVRESRRVIGQYVLTAEDLIEGKQFDDVIVHHANYCIDIHNPDGAGQAGRAGCPVQTKPYDIPYRSIVPLKNDNLFVAGRCISGTHRAHASYRVMNIVMNIGEAAGIAAALCVKLNKKNNTLHYKEIQRILTEKGINLFG